MQQTFYFLIKNENENRAKKIKQTKNKTKFLISLNEKLAKLREKKKIYKVPTTIAKTIKNLKYCNKFTVAYKYK